MHLGHGWLLIGLVLFFFSGVFKTVQFIAAFFVSMDDSRLSLFVQLTSAFYFSYLHFEAWMMKTELERLSKYDLR